MIKYSDRFSFERDKYQWVLYESYTGRDKEGNDKVHVRESYHADLKQVCAAIIDKSCDDSGPAKDISLLIETLQDAIVEKYI